MAKRTIRNRLGDHGRPVVELYEAGAAWEGLRATWHARSGDNKAEADCLKRQQFFETELTTLLEELNQ